MVGARGFPAATRTFASRRPASERGAGGRRTGRGRRSGPPPASRGRRRSSPASVTSPKPIASRRASSPPTIRTAQTSPPPDQQARQPDQEPAPGVAAVEGSGRRPGASVPRARPRTMPVHGDLVGDDIQVEVDERRGDQQRDQDHVVARAAEQGGRVLPVQAVRDRGPRRPGRRPGRAGRPAPRPAGSGSRSAAGTTGTIRAGQPAEDRDVVPGLDRREASRAARVGPDDALLPGDAVDADVQEAADDRARQEGQGAEDRVDRPVHRPCAASQGRQHLVGDLARRSAVGRDERRGPPRGREGSGPPARRRSLASMPAGVRAGRSPGARSQAVGRASRGRRSARRPGRSAAGPGGSPRAGSPRRRWRGRRLGPAVRVAIVARSSPRKSGFAVVLEDLGDPPPLGVLQLLVGVEEGPAEPLGDDPADGGLAGAPVADQGEAAVRLGGSFAERPELAADDLAHQLRPARPSR